MTLRKLPNTPPTSVNSEEGCITLGNCRDKLEEGGVIQKERLYWSKNKWKQYKLVKPIKIMLSDGKIITINEGFEWDLSSSPRFLWCVFPPDGDFEIASLIHDWIYQNNYSNRKFADIEMYLWSKASNGTHKISVKNMDNRLRYVATRLFGWVVWNKK
jgi:hypothetical protein